MGTQSLQQASLAGDEMKLDESNSVGNKEMRIANTPVDGILTVQFSGKAAVVDIPSDHNEVLKAEQEGRERVEALLDKLEKMPTAEEMNRLISNLKK